jgi:Cu(I)/Ag(I) efflux system membrane fusion protein
MKTILHISVSLLYASILIACAAAQPPPPIAGSVVDNYLNIQGALARDSMKNVSASAQGLAEAVRGGQPKSFPAAIAEQAEALSKARNLAKARKAFKPLSDSLLEYLKAHGSPPGTYYEMYCPIAKARWLQTGTEAKNPYLGLRSATATWGWACAAVVKAKFESPASSKG